MDSGKNKHPIQGSAFRNLLFFLLLYIVGSPFLAPYPSLAILAHISLTMTLFVAVYAVHRQQHRRSIAIGLLMPLLVLYWLGIYDLIPFTRLSAHLLFNFYYALLIYSFVVQIIRSSKVTMKVLYATFCIYLVLGLLWGSIYSIIYELDPEAFSGALLENIQNNAVHVFNYFSFVTLTTLGYGDITPQTQGAATFCSMEAIVGQFFTAVIVAWLVGMLVSTRQAEEEAEK